MPLIKLSNASLRYAIAPLLDAVNLQVDEGERVCLVGRNGEGKSTLLRVLNGEVQIESGQAWRQPSLRIAYLQQEVPAGGDDQTVFDVVADGLADIGKLLRDYHATANAMAHDHSDAISSRLARLQHDLEAKNGWQFQQKVDSILTRLQLDADTKMSSLSGGFKRRALFGRALVNDPDLLLLDEPTNHLDVTTIDWLEEFLLGFRGSLLFITHDRAFLRKLATRIIELDRGKLTSWPGNYDTYLERREQRLADEAKHDSEFDKKLAAEEVWIRQGIKARRTRNEGRVRALKSLRQQRVQRRNLSGTAAMAVDSGESSGKLVIEATEVTKKFGERVIFENFSTTIMRGDRVGIIGPNGSGKSTLLNVMLGNLAPDSGTMRFGTRLEIAYFDQQRAQLDLNRTAMENITDRSDNVTINGQSRHVLSYLQDFLFTPARARSLVKTLSGGERNRLLLARLFMKPANLLVLDEPTNDLDVETLEMLEEVLANYDGTVLLVSHDRAFLDNVVSSTIVFEGSRGINEYVGGYTDWLRQRRVEPQTSSQSSSQGTKQKIVQKSPTTTVVRKLSYKEQRELDQLPALIEKLESEKAALETAMGDPNFYREEKDSAQATLSRIETLTRELETVYERWAKLEKSP